MAAKGTKTKREKVDDAIVLPIPSAKIPFGPVALAAAAAALVDTLVAMEARFGLALALVFVP